jgi:phospholipid/cholesterol/gamma-HCH transport system substrate-binding protein
MINRRVWINLAAFLALFVVLASWAVRNVVSLDQIERPYRIDAEFESSPGLQANVEATYLGVHVGSVDAVALADDHVDVAIDIDRDVRLPEGLSAAVRRKSAVGEPYVALDPPAGADADTPTIDPDEGYRIPLERTSIPLSYGNLFASIDELVTAVPPEDFGTVIHELAVALEDRGPELRAILASADDLTGTLAERSQVLDELATDLTTLTHTLASHRDGIGSAFDDLNALTTTLVDHRAEIQHLLEEAPGFGAQVQALLETTYADLSCTFADIGTVFREVGTAERISDLIRLLRVAGTARDALDSALVEPGEGGAEGPYLGGSFGLVADDPPPAYASPKTLPPAPALQGCDAPGAPTRATERDAGSSRGSGAAGRPGDRFDIPARQHPGAVELPDSSRADAGSQAFPLATVILAVGAALGLALLAGVRPWRWLPVADREDSEDDA